MVWRATSSSMAPQPALARSSPYSFAVGKSSASTMGFISVSRLACAAGLMATLRLAHIHGAVGLLQRGARLRMAIEDGNADRGSGLHCAAAERDAHAVDRLLQHDSLRPRIGLAEIPQQHGELVAAEPADDVGGAHLAQERLDNCPQDLVARGMPIRIVDRLQPVDVEHQQRGARRIALDESDRARQFALEAAAVENVEQ